jgi:hypothetical protein
MEPDGGGNDDELAREAKAIAVTEGQTQTFLDYESRRGETLPILRGKPLGSVRDVACPDFPFSIHCLVTWDVPDSEHQAILQFCQLPFGRKSS